MGGAEAGDPITLNLDQIDLDNFLPIEYSEIYNEIKKESKIASVWLQCNLPRLEGRSLKRRIEDP